MSRAHLLAIKPQMDTVARSNTPEDRASAEHLRRILYGPTRRAGEKRVYESR